MTESSPCPVCGKPVAPNAPRGLCPDCLMQTGLTGTQTEGADASPTPPPPPVEEIAPLFPQLEVLELRGRGGMGAVYKARQPQLDRFVALKLLLRRSQDPAQDNAFAERFAREARALARLNHPNIVTVYDYGQAGGYSFLVMEYVEGLTLRQMLQSGRLEPERALEIVPQVCDALQFAHQQGVVHRDIKPENILLDAQGRVKIGDFGIAKVAGPATGDGLTQDQQVVGTPHYMAPEQFEKPQSVDHRADIYALGVVFYEMLTGELPLGKFAPPSQKSWADERLDQVVLHALEKEPERRYQQASEVKTDVETITATPQDARAPKHRAPPPLSAGVAPYRGSSLGWKLVLAAGVLGLGAVLAVLWLALVRDHRPKPAVISHKPASQTKSNAWWALLNEDQRLVLQWTDRTFHQYDDERTFDGWPDAERDQLERRSIDTLRGPHNAEFFLAINTLAALRSTNAVPALRKIACEPGDKLLRAEVSNRPRWMATRALGSIGDKRVVPELVHLLYHNQANVRWWAQISLVQLTGQNFSGDWKTWGDWWNAYRNQPPFQPELVHWSKAQAEPALLDGVVTEGDRRFIAGLKKRVAAGGTPPISAEATVEAPEPSASTNAKPQPAADSRTSQLNQTKPIKNQNVMNDQNNSSSVGGLIAMLFVLLIALGVYVFYCFCCKRICQKAGREPGALIWIPILQLVPLLEAAGMATWMIILFLLPLVNLVLAVMMWAKICMALSKTPWLVLMMFIPPLNLIFLPYLAFSGPAPANAPAAPPVAA